MDDNLSPQQIHGMLRLKRLELAQQIAEDQARLARLESQLTQFEKESKMPAYEVVIKQVDKMQIAGLRDIVANYQSIGPLYEALFTALGQYDITPIGPTMGIYYDEGNY